MKTLAKKKSLAENKVGAAEEKKNERKRTNSFIYAILQFCRVSYIYIYIYIYIFIYLFI